MSALSRRGFLGAGVAAAAVAALPIPKGPPQALARAGSASMKVGDTFTISGVHATTHRWDVFWGQAPLQKFTVISA